MWWKREQVRILRNGIGAIWKFDNSCAGPPSWRYLRSQSLQIHHVVKATWFKDDVDDWQDLNDKDYFQRQEYLFWHGTDIKLKSDNWLDDVLQLMMEKMLHSEVESDLKSIPKIQSGSIATLQCIIKRMVVRNQEAWDALGTYIKTFNITKFRGENVPTAILCLKAVAKALRENDFPTNVTCTILERFAK